MSHLNILFLQYILIKTKYGTMDWLIDSTVSPKPRGLPLSLVFYKVYSNVEVVEESALTAVPCVLGIVKVVLHLILAGLHPGTCLTGGTCF